MEEDKLKNIIHGKVQAWESGHVIPGEPQPSEMVWDKINSKLPVKTASLMKTVFLVGVSIVTGFGLGYVANELISTPKNTDVEISLQEELPPEPVIKESAKDTLVVKKKKKMKVEVIDMDSLEKSKKKDYILYNNSKIYLNKGDSTGTKEKVAE